MAIGYRFPILTSGGNATTTVVDMDDMFVPLSRFKEQGLFGWGQNASQIGDNTGVTKSSPVQIGSLTNWKMAVSNGGNSFAVKRDGTLWAWGNNGSGSLAINSPSVTSSPVQVGTLTDWSFVTCGDQISNFALSIKQNGTLWSWGSNSNGQLGLGDVTTRSSPALVGTETDWKIVSAGRDHGTAIRKNGTAWAWGRNQRGQLAQGDILSRSSPRQIGARTDWSLIAAGGYTTALISVGGQLWTVGDAFFGTTGLGDTIQRSSPVQVGSLTTWKQVAASTYFSMSAIQTDGSLWAWGYNGFGNLGLGDTNSRSSPTRVGTLSNWKQVSVDYYTTAAVKTDGTLWTWGRNDKGELGDGTIISKSSPIQVGTATYWRSVSAGTNDPGASPGSTILAIADYDYYD